MTLSLLAAQGLGLEPTTKNLAYKETTHRSKYRPFLFFFFFYIVFFTIGLATIKENKEKAIASGTEGEEDVQVQDNTTPLVV